MRIDLIAAVVGTLCVASPTTADIVTSWYEDKDSYNWKCLHMPDFDQKRTTCPQFQFFGLPGDGYKYCVPASSMNVLAYAANHGFPNLEPGAANWQNQFLYSTVSLNIAQLAVLMQTTSADGTDLNGWYYGIWNWLAYNEPFVPLCVIVNGTTKSWTPRAYSMAKAATQGSLVGFAYGRYVITNIDDVYLVLEREGGHAITLTQAQSGGNGTKLRYRDPNDVPYDCLQSTFSSREVEPVPYAMIFEIWPGEVRNVTLLEYPPADDKFRILDAIFTLTPMYGLSYTGQGGLAITKVAPFALEGQGGASVPLAIGFGIADLAIDIEGTDAMALVYTSIGSGATALQRIDLSTGEQMTLGSSTTYKRFCVGRSGEIYAHDGIALFRLAPDGSVLSAASTLTTPTAMAYDDENDHVLVLSVPQRKLLRLTTALAPVSTFNIPATTALSGDGSVTANPFDDTIYFCSDASNKIHSLAGIGPAFTFASHDVAGLVAPKSISTMQGGGLAVSAQGQLAVLQATGDRRSQWELDPNSAYSGAAVGDRLTMLASRTNFDPSVHGVPGWNLGPDDTEPSLGIAVADCLADLDSDNDVDAGDLAILLGAWGDADGDPDINSDGAVTAADLALLLGAWGPCP